MTIFTPEK